MSVTICADGVFDEHALELTSYLARPQPEEEREAWVQSTFGDLKSGEVEESKKSEVVAKIVDQVKAFGEGSEKEVEGFFNLLLALILSVHPIDSSEFAAHYSKILDAVVSDRRRELRRAQYQILSNLHNLLPPTSPLRLPTLSALLSLASTHSDLSSLASSLSPSNLTHQLSLWPQPLPEKAAFIASVAQAFSSSSSTSSSSSSSSSSATAYPYYLLQLDYLNGEGQDEQKTVEGVLGMALRLNGVFDFGGLLAHESVKRLEGKSQVHELVGLFADGGLKEWKAWEDKNGQVLQGLGLSSDELTKKIRYLTLATLCSTSTSGSGEVSYKEIAQALEVDEKDVEVWVIDTIRLSLLSAKLSQPTRSLRVQKAYIRSFGASEWKTLQARLAAWDENLAGVAEVVQGAVALGGGASAEVGVSA